VIPMAFADPSGFPLRPWGAHWGRCLQLPVCRRKNGRLGPILRQVRWHRVPRTHRARAKRLYIPVHEGGPSHIDTFDPKSRLDELHMREFVRRDPPGVGNGERAGVITLRSPFGFQKAGRAGIDLCTNFEHLARRRRELCVYRGCVAESIDHPRLCLPHEYRPALRRRPGRRRLGDLRPGNRKPGYGPPSSCCPK